MFELYYIIALVYLIVALAATIDCLRKGADGIKTILLCVFWPFAAVAAMVMLAQIFISKIKSDLK